MKTKVIRGGKDILHTGSMKGCKTFLRKARVNDCQIVQYDRNGAVARKFKVTLEDFTGAGYVMPGDRNTTKRWPGKAFKNVVLTQVNT